MAKSTIQLPPDSTGKTVGTFTDGNGYHYHGFVEVDTNGYPVTPYIVNLLETVVLELQDLNRNLAALAAQTGTQSVTLTSQTAGDR